MKEFFLFGRFTLLLALLGLTVVGFSQDKAVVTAKHWEPIGYPPLARQARLQGSISIDLKISSSGNVVDAEASTADALLKEHPLLQKETVKLVRKWTFSCVANCPPNADYKHGMTFVYRLEGEETQHNTSRFTIDSPDHVTVTANPPQVNW